MWPNLRAAARTGMGLGLLLAMDEFCAPVLQRNCFGLRWLLQTQLLAKNTLLSS